MSLRDNILTSTVVADVWLGTVTTFLITTDRISRTFIVECAVNDFGAFDVRIWFGYRTSRANAIERSR